MSSEKVACNHLPKPLNEGDIWIHVNDYRAPPCYLSFIFKYLPLQSKDLSAQSNSNDKQTSGKKESN